jgi:hypothetical protein
MDEFQLKCISAELMHCISILYLQFSAVIDATPELFQPQAKLKRSEASVATISSLVSCIAHSALCFARGVYANKQEIILK